MIRAVQRLLRGLGLEVKRYLPSRTEAAQIARLLRTHQITLVFDVGANTGQYGQFLRDAGYIGQIVSFEPLKSAHENLVASAKADAKWIIAPRMALGDTQGEVALNVAGNSASSSLLPMSDAHLEVAPFAAYSSRESVPLARLDGISEPYLGEHQGAFLKVDTQGYEDRVLSGAKGILHRIRGIQLELSLVRLYEGQCLFEEMYQTVRDLGFELHAIFPEFYDQASGRLLQFDGVFFRPLNRDHGSQ